MSLHFDYNTAFEMSMLNDNIRIMSFIKNRKHIDKRLKTHCLTLQYIYLKDVFFLMLEKYLINYTIQLPKNLT